MIAGAKRVTSNQSGIHASLERVVKKHLSYPYKKPVRKFSEDIFHQMDAVRKKINAPVILDSGCGSGESSSRLAKKFADHLIIGIDRSGNRLERFVQDKTTYHKNNLILARADNVDIWRLALQADWDIEKHYLLYPNPWPKQDQLKRRWHGHPVFPALIGLCNNIELRTNWKIYAEEFKTALEIVTDKQITVEVIATNDYISPFEKKYYESGHQLYKVSLE